MSSADIAACFPSEHDSLLGTDVESRRRSSKPFYLTRSSLETRKKEQGGLAGWWARFGEGGTIFDAFLMEASQQVGQSLLTLPWAFSLMGYGWAITSLLGLSLISMWTQHLLIALHAEYRMRLSQDKEHPRHGDEDYIASYHEVFGYLMNKWWGRFSVVIVFLALLGLTVAQIIATSSNLYLLNESLPKRTYAIICGAVFSLLSFQPTFRHYRLFVLVGLIATFYTACFLTFNAISRGPLEGVSHDSPTRKQKFFSASKRCRSRSPSALTWGRSRS